MFCDEEHRKKIRSQKYIVFSTTMLKSSVFILGNAMLHLFCLHAAFLANPFFLFLVPLVQYRNYRLHLPHRHQTKPHKSKIYIIFLSKQIKKQRFHKVFVMEYLKSSVLKIRCMEIKNKRLIPYWITWITS